MSGTENEAPASLPTSPLVESTFTTDKYAKKRTHIPDFKVYNENVINQQQSPTGSPVRSPLSEKTSTRLPTIVVPPEHGRRSPAATRPKSPPSISSINKKPTPLTEKVREALYDATVDEDVKHQVANLQKQLEERRTRLEKLKQQKNEKDEELREARSKTALLQQQLKEVIQVKIPPTERMLQVTEDDVERVRERVRHLENEINDNKDIVQEFAQLTEDGEKEAMNKEKEIDNLMNLIPEKLVRIQELKQLLGLSSTEEE
ncbi:hypothetical protein INT45_001043 [Circinella minor]|uniref:Uncharacterized protein n=1 Tax=Circinella minor TaxID=1195481 RepID=A0A8H7SE96_9FUNG|nr:hypothetical protein INT45_001043 [Circinella minor]